MNNNKESSSRMTDAEVVATFMAPEGQRFGLWWNYEAGMYESNGKTCNSLDALHLVEARLTDPQWGEYSKLWPSSDWPGSVKTRKALLHADAQEKLKALATVLRPVVEGAKA